MGGGEGSLSENICIVLINQSVNTVLLPSVKKKKKKKKTHME